MSAAIAPTTLAREVREIGELLPDARPAELPGIARRLIRLADLAHLIELELQNFRDLEAGREMRTGFSRSVEAGIAATTDDNVIELGRRK